MSCVCDVLLLPHCSLNTSNQSFLSGHIARGSARITETGETSGATRSPPAHQGARGEPKEVRSLRARSHRLPIRKAPSPFSVEMYCSLDNASIYFHIIFFIHISANPCFTIGLKGGCGLTCDFVLFFVLFLRIHSRLFEKYLLCFEYECHLLWALRSKQTNGLSVFGTGMFCT